jgi:hypothetical protein
VTNEKGRILLTAQRLQNLLNLADRPPQPWSRELLKLLHRQAKRRQEPLRAIEAHQLEILLVAQDFRCAYSRRRLILPDEVDLRTAGGYDRWLAGLTPVNYQQAAALVRLNAGEPWQRGNLMFLSAPWAALHQSFTDLAVAVKEIRDVADRLSEGQLAILAVEDYYKVAAATTRDT